MLGSHQREGHAFFWRNEPVVREREVSSTIALKEEQTGGIKGVHPSGVTSPLNGFVENFKHVPKNEGSPNTHHPALTTISSQPV